MKFISQAIRKIKRIYRVFNKCDIVKFSERVRYVTKI